MSKKLTENKKDFKVSILKNEFNLKDELKILSVTNKYTLEGRVTEAALKRIEELEVENTELKDVLGRLNNFALGLTNNKDIFPAKKVGKALLEYIKLIPKKKMNIDAFGQENNVD